MNGYDLPRVLMASRSSTMISELSERVSRAASSFTWE